MNRRIQKLLDVVIIGGTLALVGWLFYYAVTRGYLNLM
jgi:hypothetical protein